MELTRTIHPIGQGGFYTETIKDDNDREFNIVYDCGGNSQSFMKSYFDSYLLPKTIDAVFISHLHDDHINGLDYLLSNKNVKNLILPQLTDNIALEAYLYNTIKTGKFENISNQCLLKLYTGESYRETKIIQIESSNGDVNLDLNDNQNQNDGNLSFDTSSIKNKDTVRCGIVFNLGQWLFIPYNPPISSKESSATSFYEFFKKQLDIDDFLFDGLPNLLKNKKIDKIKKIYSDYFGERNHNSYSMALFSGLKEPDCFCVHSKFHERCRHCDCCPEYYHRHRHHCSPNMLYTGDFEKDNVRALKAFYNPLWETIRTIQVPHHGSRNNFEPELYSDAYRGIISAAAKSRYHHPNIDTLINIRKVGCSPIVTTEDKSTMQVYDYFF